MALLSVLNIAFSAPNSSGTGTATAGAATLNADSGLITTEALTTAGLANYTLTITNNKVAAGDIAIPILTNSGTSTTGSPYVEMCTCTANTITIIVRNQHATVALNGTLVVGFVVFKQPIS